MKARLLQAIRDDAGQTLVLVGVSIIMLLGLAAFAIDVGAVLNAHRQLQASTDAAATAAAQELSTQTRANVTAKAVQYSGQSGQKNVYANLGGVSITTAFKCLTSVGMTTPCTNTATANAVTVTSTAAYPLFFARVLGFSTMNISATATATMKSGAMPPLDVIIVLDTTGSMSGTPLTQAKAGIRTLLGTLWPCAPDIPTCGGGDPVIDQAGLFVFPGVTNATSVGREYDCSSSPDPVIANYSASPIYEIIPMTNDYRTSTTAALNTNSNYVKAVDGRSGCSGAEAIGGFGSYFANAITQAQAKLASSGRANVQNVIIFVSDGEANQYTGGPANPCRQAITAAQAAKAAGTWVYSIRYYGGSDSAVCANDSPSITAKATMQQINSDYPSIDTGKFFNSPSGSSLVATFQKIGVDLTTTRMVDDSTP